MAVDLPKKERGCTDIICLIVFVVHWFVFIAVIFVGAQHGNPHKLYKPRDYKGDYCGLGDYEAAENGIFMMNVSHTAESVAKQLTCSTASSSALSSIWGSSSSQYTNYLCACCLLPCASCKSSLEQEDIATGSVSSVVGGRMSELTNIGSGDSLFSSSSANAGSFSAEDIWSQITVFFTQVCVAENCDVPQTAGFAGYRLYTYSPAADLPWKEAWDTLTDNTAVPADIRNAISSSFTFQALSEERCPYDAKYCVPFPGVNFTESVPDWCMPQPNSQVVDALGAQASSALEGLGAGSLAGTAQDGVGTLFETMDALVLVCFLAFIVGLLFLVLLRFLIAIAIWGSLVAVFFAMLIAGLMCFIRSGQCANAGFFESGHELGQAGLSAATHLASGGDFNSEDISGNGADYVGFQTHTRSGRKCQGWAVNDPHTQPYTDLATFAGSPSSLADVKNYCRNPAEAQTIWCYTEDPEKVWELCTPIGVLQPQCGSTGFMVADKWNRDALKITAYVIWCLAGLWLLIVWCLLKRIKLAIALSRVAAQFIMNTPTVVLVPLVQVVIGLSWCLIWATCASFLVSQVPEDYVPTESYANYSDAAGTADTAGACTDKWPTGFVWKDEESDLCSASEAVPKCWKCGLPRYVLDVRFAFAFFSFLWNNALIIAFGQCTIAFACAVWFFKPREAKGDTTQTTGVCKAVYTSFRFHLGSLAFGAFILAVVQFIRYFLKYLEMQAKSQKNRVMQYVLRCLQCCLWCFEKSIKFLNKNAYIQIAIHGTNFCTSAKNAFMLILNNAVRISVLAIIGSALNFLGWVFVAAATAGIGYFMLQAMHPSVSPVLPVICYAVIGWLVGKLFMNVYALSVDTSLQCFIEAEQQGDNTCIPKQLKDMVEDKKNHKTDDGAVDDRKVAPSPGSDTEGAK